MGGPADDDAAAGGQVAAVLALARRVAEVDPALGGELAAVTVAVDAHAAALEAALRRFDQLEERLGRAIARLGERAGTQAEQEREFAALLGYLGSTRVRERLERLRGAFPD